MWVAAEAAALIRVEMLLFFTVTVFTHNTKLTNIAIIIDFHLNLHNAKVMNVLVIFSPLLEQTGHV